MNESDLNYRQPALTSPRGRYNPKTFEENIASFKDQNHKYNPETDLKYELYKDAFNHGIKLPLTTRSLNLRESDLFKKANSHKMSFIEDKTIDGTSKNMKHKAIGHNNDYYPYSVDAQYIKGVPNEGDMSMCQPIYSSDFKTMKNIQIDSLISNAVVDSNEHPSVVSKESFSHTLNMSGSRTGEQKIGSAFDHSHSHSHSHNHNHNHRNSINGKLFTSEDSRLQLEAIKNQLAGTNEVDAFVDILANSKDNDVLHLPERLIRIDTLVITKPLKIVGSPHSILEIAGSITIDLSNYPKLNEKVCFSECKILFAYPALKTTKPQTTTSRSGPHNESNKNFESKPTKNSSTGTGASAEALVSEDKMLPLFTVKYNSALEMCDCEIKSLNHQTDQATGSLTNDVAFFLKHPRTTQFHEEGPNLSLIIENCSISNFYTGIESQLLSKIIVENSYFADCHYYAVNLSNPHFFKINNSTIQRPEKSGINVRFSKLIDQSLNRRVTIEACSVIDSRAYGISIFGENMTHHKCKISINGNKIIRSRKDGLGIKSLSMQEINIENNFICESQGNGIFLQSVIDCEESTLVEMKNNKLDASSLYGIAVIDASLLSEHDELTRNQKGGMIISGGETIAERKEYEFFKSRPLRCIFNSSIVKHNKDSGIILVGCLKGPIVLNSCEICENLNGLYARLKPIPLLDNHAAEQGRGSARHNPLAANSNSIGHIVLDKCNIFQNRESGIVLRSLSEKMFFKETIVQQNKVYAIELASAEDKNNLVLEKLHLRQFIDGFIGGEWGLLYDEHQGICKTNAKCQIF